MRWSQVFYICIHDDCVFGLWLFLSVLIIPLFWLMFVFAFQSHFDVVHLCFQLVVILYHTWCVNVSIKTIAIWLGLGLRRTRTTWLAKPFLSQERSNMHVDSLEHTHFCPLGDKFFMFMSLLDLNMVLWEYIFSIGQGFARPWSVEMWIIFSRKTMFAGGIWTRALFWWFFHGWWLG